MVKLRTCSESFLRASHAGRLASFARAHATISFPFGPYAKSGVASPNFSSCVRFTRHRTLSSRLPIFPELLRQTFPGTNLGFYDVLCAYTSENINPAKNRSTCKYTRPWAPMALELSSQGWGRMSMNLTECFLTRSNDISMQNILCGSALRSVDNPISKTFETPPSILLYSVSFCFSRSHFFSPPTSLLHSTFSPQQPPLLQN